MMKFIENMYAKQSPTFTQNAGPNARAYIKAATNGATATKRGILDTINNGGMKQSDFSTLSKEARQILADEAAKKK